MKPVELAVGVIVDEYDRILLLHRNTDEFSHWELPGGKIEADETAEQAAARELQEELGVNVHLLKPIGTDMFEVNDKEYQVTWCLVVMMAGEPSVRETNTFDDLDYFDIDDMLSMSLSGSMALLLEKIASGEIAISG